MKCPTCQTEINPAAEMARLRASKQTPERRKEISAAALRARWGLRLDKLPQGLDPIPNPGNKDDNP